jgi:biopolymer transport protein ExbD
MAQLESNDGGGGKKKKGGSKQKKMSMHVDFTPMVDMNMLLITFFMLCTSLSKPQTMEITMPSNDKVQQEQANKVKASKAITILLSGKDKVYYFTGEPKYNDPTSLNPTTYKSSGLRKFLLSKNVDAVKEVEKLKKEKSDKLISKEACDSLVRKTRGGKETPTVIIKATDDANYKNLVDALDEMQICSIGKYVIVPISKQDRDLIKSYELANNLPLSNLK